MRNSLVRLFISSSLGLALFALPTASVGAPTLTPFPDVAENHPFLDSIDDLKAHKFVAGHPNGTFTPDRTIPRAEFITIVIASIDSDPKGANCFDDVQNQWYARFICSAKTRGLVAGHPDGTFKPGDNISLAEASAIMTRAYDLKKTKAGPADPWYRPFVENLADDKAIPYSIDNVSQPLSRGETSEIIWRLNEKNHEKPSKNYVNVNSEVPLLESCSELKEKFDHLAYKKSKRYSHFDDFKDEGEDEQIFDFAIPELATQALQKTRNEESSTVSADAAEAGAGVESADFTETNVQVQGVDEGDIVKTDGEYIYIANNAELKIVKATPAGEMELIAELPLLTEEERNSKYVGYSSLTELYVNENTLVAIHPSINVYQRLNSFAKINAHKQSTMVQLVDISDKKDPKITRELTFDGNQVSSRRIGNRLFLATNFSPNYYEKISKEANNTNIVDLLPHVTDSTIKASKTLTTCSNIRFIPEYEQINFLSVVQINLEDHQAEFKKEVIMGSGENIYANTESLYVAASRFHRPVNEVFDVWAPPVEQPTTVLYKFDISEDKLTLKDRGAVPGKIINQFAMDEADDSFRIATTVWQWHTTKELSPGNYVTTLNKDNLSETLGQTEPLSPGEQIYSVRFMGNRVYMVTFRQIDPFYVIDLSDPRNPTVLGELKLPGFSDYLHPYDENHVIGFGKNTVLIDDFPPFMAPLMDVGEMDMEIEPAMDIMIVPEPRAQIEGFKIALFDVTDVKNPKVKFTEIIGELGTDSELLNNHRALMYDKERGLFAFPITVHEKTDEFIYPVPTFRGAYVYNLDLENGFQLKGKLSHYDEKTDIRTVPYNRLDENDIKRVIRIGEHLYSVGYGRIKASDLETLSQQKLIELPKNPVGQETTK